VSENNSQLSRKLRSWRLRLGCFSLRMALASICRMRSRVTLNCWPTSSSVWSVFMPMPKRMRSTRSSRGVREASTRVVVSRRFHWIAASIGRTALRSSIKSPRRLSSSSPIGVSRLIGSLASFRTRLPEKGQIVVFDRSWYGRVLVERVEGFATSKEWRRAYREINEFERLLVDSGVRLVKLFLHITSDEQERRFRNRLIDPLKRWKLTYEDFRNRDRRSDYETAIEDMIEETSTKHAPWYLIPANNKPYGRIAALRILADRLGKDVSLEPRPIDPGLIEEAKRTLHLTALDIERASHSTKQRVKLKRNKPQK
jgi:hypothetical protein